MQAGNQVTDRMKENLKKSYGVVKQKHVKKVERHAHPHLVQHLHMN